MDADENIHRQSSLLEHTTSSLTNNQDFLGDDQPSASGFDEQQILDEPTRECKKSCSSSDSDGMSFVFSVEICL